MGDKVWYIAVNGKSDGPYSEDEITEKLKTGVIDKNTYLFTHGMDNWKPLNEIPQFKDLNSSRTTPVPPIPQTHSGKICHEIEYKIHGHDMQFVEIILDPGEKVVAEAGAMMYMPTTIQMETIFGDGSQKNSDKGFMGKLLDAGKRVITGESLFMTVFTNGGTKKESVSFGAPYPGKIIPVDLSKIGGTIICQKDAFLCAAYGTSIGIAFNKRIGAGFFGGEGFIMEKLEGDGLVFIHACGTIIELNLSPGETLKVDTGCIVAFDPSITYDVQFVGGIKTAIFGGEGLFFATVTGPGKVYLQSLPFSRLADRIYTHAPSAGGSRKGEGSILGSLGDLIDGD